VLGILLHLPFIAKAGARVACSGQNPFFVTGVAALQLED
jgi:hypothetical protein